MPTDITILEASQNWTNEILLQITKKIINLLWLGVQLKYILKYIYMHVFIMFCGQQTENLPQNHNRSKMNMPRPAVPPSNLARANYKNNPHNSCVCVCVETTLSQWVKQEQLHEANKHNQTLTHTHTPEHNQTKLSVTKPNQTLRGNPSDATTVSMTLFNIMRFQRDCINNITM